MPLAPGCNRCKAEQWQRDGRGLWAKRACTGLASHGGSHSFGLWEHNPQTQNPTDELLAALRALVEIYGPSTDYGAPTAARRSTRRRCSEQSSQRSARRPAARTARKGDGHRPRIRSDLGRNARTSV
jgi:hypothetical protein